MKVTKAQLEEMIAKAAAERPRVSIDEGSALFAAITAKKTEDTTPVRPAIAGARMVRAIAGGRGDAEGSARYAQDTLKDTRVSKALQAGVWSSAGFLLPHDVSDDIIQLLTPRSVMRAAGARSMPMPGGSLELQKWSSGSQASYVGENQPPTASDIEGGMVRMSEKELVALVPISKRLIRNAGSAGHNVEQYVLDDMLRSVSLTENEAFLRSPGTEFRPRGLRYLARPGNVTQSTGNTKAFIEADLERITQFIESANVQWDRPAFFMASRSFNYLKWRVTDDLGRHVFKDELKSVLPGAPNSQGTLDGKPVHVTNIIPTNIGGNRSELYLAEMTDVVIGENGSIMVDVSDEASYTDPNTGQLVSAFERRQVLMQMSLLQDFAVRHAESIAVLEEITWGAA